MSLSTFGDINYLAVLVAATSYFAVGALWFSPVMFARPWMEATGVGPDAGTNVVPLFAMTFVAWFLAALAMAFLARETGATSVRDGLVLGLVTGIGLAATVLAVTQTFERRAALLQLINIGHNVVGLIAVAVIVTVWD